MRGKRPYIYKCLPSGQFTAKEANLNGGQLAKLASEKRIRKVGTCGRCAIWEAV